MLSSNPSTGVQHIPDGNRDITRVDQEGLHTYIADLTAIPTSSRHYACGRLHEAFPAVVPRLTRIRHFSCPSAMSTSNGLAEKEPDVAAWKDFTACACNMSSVPSDMHMCSPGSVYITSHTYI